jgi:hypothetical protein
MEWQSIHNHQQQHPYAHRLKHNILIADSKQSLCSPNLVVKAVSTANAFYVFVAYFARQYFYVVPHRVDLKIGGAREKSQKNSHTHGRSEQTSVPNAKLARITSLLI